MLTIYLARHGQDEDNANVILNGHRDTPLTALGIQQAQELARNVQELGLHFDAVYASPLQRAFKTAEITSKVTGNPAPIALPELIERDFGVMTGLTRDRELIARMCAPDLLESEHITYFVNPEGGESFPVALERAQRAIDYVRKHHQDGNILLVTHGDIGKMLYAAYYNHPWQEILLMFHFGNSELLELSADSDVSSFHRVQIEQQRS